MRVFDDRIEASRGKNDVRALWRISPGQFRSAAAWNHCEGRIVGQFENMSELLLVAGCDDEFRLHASDLIFPRGGLNVLGADGRTRSGFKRSNASHCVGWCARVHRQKRSAIPADSSSCGTYLPGFSPQRRGRGKTLPGLESCNGSKAQRTRCIVSRSGSLNIFDIARFLSSPTPCSPVIDPPAAMQISRILYESASAASSCPAMRRS